jgi:hypothetical protein
VIPRTNCSATETMLSEPLARRVRVVAAFVVDVAFLAPAVAAVAVPFAPERAAFAFPGAAEPAVLAVDVAPARVARADREVLAAPDCAGLRVPVAPAFACVEARPAALRVLVADDLAPVRAAACVRSAPLLRVDELVRLSADSDDDEDEDVDCERLAGGIVSGS